MSADSRRSTMRGVVAIVVAVGVALGLGLLGGYLWTKARPPAGATALGSTSPAPSTTGSPSCRPSASPHASTVAAAWPAPATISVNVYNATTRVGLARDTAAAMTARGFHVLAVANDPLGETVASPAVVRYGPAGLAQAHVVAAYVAGGATLQPDTRTSTSVDLVLGQAWTAVASPAQAAATLAGPHTQPTC